MSKVIVIAHRKGGVGKTTTAVHLATGLAGMRVPVVAIDLDPQGNLGQFLGMGTAPDVYDLLMARQPERALAGALVELPNRQYPYLRIVRGDNETKAAEIALGTPQASRTLVGALDNVIRAIQANFRSNGQPPFVILDTPPGLGLLQVSALTVADYLLIPINPSFASETGLPRLAEVMKTIRERSGRCAVLLGILPTRYKKRTLEHQDVLEVFKSTFGDDLIYPPVRDTVRLEETVGRGRPVWDYDPKGIGAQDYPAVLKRFLDDMGLLPNGSRRNGKRR
jgi:chromosome partitioning protein